MYAIQNYLFENILSGSAVLTFTYSNWQKACASGAHLHWRGFESHRCQLFYFLWAYWVDDTVCIPGYKLPPPMNSNSSSEQPMRLAPFNPTCTHAQKVALDMMLLEAGDVLFDIGCGDARLLVTAAERTAGLKCVGIEIDPVYVKRARAALSEAPLNVASRVEIQEGDVMRLIDAWRGGDDDDGELSLIDDASAVFVYLLPKGLEAMRPLLEEIAKKRRSEGGAFRVVSYMFRIPGWEPTTIDRTTKGDCPVYLYNLSEIRQDL